MQYKVQINGIAKYYSFFSFRYSTNEKSLFKKLLNQTKNCY